MAPTVGEGLMRLKYRYADQVLDLPCRSVEDLAVLPSLLAVFSGSARHRRRASRSPEQLDEVHVESVGDSYQRFNRRVRPALLDAGVVRRQHVDDCGEALLRLALRTTEFLDPEPQGPKYGFRLRHEETFGPVVAGKTE